MEYGITANISGLKCDNSACDYKDKSIKLEQYESYINAPCPACGSSLLTQADYDQVQSIIAMMEDVNSKVTSGEFPVSPNGEKASVSFEFNGTGTVEAKIEKLS
ncbi:hypothetical protein [Psychrobacillus sp. FSL K6-1464]|uniref:hypothetical protein n=1 Tax=Psychrobacillus sp. FSL K6-1464 TaxID=2921545 RepID=UPI0030F88822